MPSPYELFGTDKSLESEKGVDIDYGDFVITIHRAGGANTEYKRVFAEKLKPYQRQYENGTMDDERLNQIAVDVFAETVVKGWDGVKDREGNDLECTRENIIQVFTDLPDLFGDIVEQAKHFANFQADNKEAASKNSKAS